MRALRVARSTSVPRVTFVEIVAAGGGLYVEARAAAKQRHPAAAADVLVGFHEILLEFVYVVFRSGRLDIDEMVGDIAVFGQVLAGTDVHPAIDLAGVSRDDLGTEPTGKRHRVAGLARGRRPEHADEIDAPVAQRRGERLLVDRLGSRELRYHRHPFLGHISFNRVPFRGACPFP